VALAATALAATALAARAIALVLSSRLKVLWCYVRPLREEVAALTPKELDVRSPGWGEQVNGLSLSRIASADNGVILAVAGEIDISNAQEFGDDMRSLIGGAEGQIVLNLENCGFIDSTGIKELIGFARELRMRGQTLVLSGLDGEPRRVFEVTGLLDAGDFAIRDEARDVRPG
jgi:anti-anti-sigma factor